MAGTLDGVLALCEVMADKERSRQYLIDLKRITDDAGRDAARLEAQKYEADLSRREKAVAQREEEQRQLAADLDAAGRAIEGRMRALDERDAAATAREARLDERQAKLQADEATVATVRAALDAEAAVDQAGRDGRNLIEMRSGWPCSDIGMLSVEWTDENSPHGHRFVPHTHEATRRYGNPWVCGSLEQKEVHMGGIVRSGVAAHDAACLAAEVTRQAAVSGSPTQATVTAAEIVYHRAVIASAKANNGGNGVEASLSALMTLGVNA